MSLLAAAEWIALLAMTALIGAIVYLIWTGRINLQRLISEPNGDASMSRFQLLVFTIVVAFALFIIVVSGDKPAFPDTIPANVLTLLGISASSYLVSKGIQHSSDEGAKHVDPDAKDDESHAKKG